jgi:hypothetical protein
VHVAVDTVSGGVPADGVGHVYDRLISGGGSVRTDRRGDRVTVWAHYASSRFELHPDLGGLASVSWYVQEQWDYFRRFEDDPLFSTNPNDNGEAVILDPWVRPRLANGGELVTWLGDGLHLALESDEGSSSRACRAGTKPFKSKERSPTRTWALHRPSSRH